MSSNASLQNAGFAVWTYGEDHIEENTRETNREAPEWVRGGVVSKDGKITKKGWDLLNKDVSTLERNAVSYLQKKFPSARGEGHANDDLVGTVWFDPKKLQHAQLIELGISERIDMVDQSYGDLARYVWKGVSDFGKSVLGGHITFFGVGNAAKDQIEDTLDRARKRTRR